MLLYYHKDPGRNFGDDLNPWLWPRVFPGAFAGEVLHDPRERTSFPSSEPLFVGIGTLLNQHVPTDNRKIVFGAGVGYGDTPTLDESWDIRFVRGPRTARKLGLDPSLGITDPAVLAVDHFQGGAEGSLSPAFMPHCASIMRAEWDELCRDVGVRFIDPRWDVERVLSEIQRTSVLLTEALHGAIIADAFRVPWHALVTSPTVLEFKWFDWTESIGLDYRPSRLVTLWGPGSGRFGPLRHAAKKVLARRQLKNLLKSNQPVLSDERVLKEKKERIWGQVHKLRAEIEQGIRC